MSFKKDGIKICCLFFFFIVFCFSFYAPGKISAKLEAPYPPITGHTLTETSSLPDFAIYLFSAGMSLGFLIVFISLVLAGIQYLLSPAIPQMRADARDRAGGAISGLLILVLTYLIITTINPDLKTFTLKPLPKSTLPPITVEMSGVYFYDKAGCSDSNNGEQVDETAQLNTYSLSDLGDLKNKVNSAKIVQDSKSGYISILYDNPDFWGKCLYLNPNAECQSATDPDDGGSFADSASIYRYDFSSSGDGVYFYRKSYFDENGGWFKVANGEIKSGGGGDIYSEWLDNLYFLGDKNECNVPEEEQNCKKYNEKGKCEERYCPSLGDKNISSIKIKGDYLVLLTYAGPGQVCNDTLADSCQEFPTLDDVNKTGPQQIKWEHIRNDKGVIPNCVTIIPIKY